MEDNKNTNTVYMHINKINGKKYIGITKNKPEDRWKNGTHYEHNPYLTNSIKKNKWENFDHVILKEGLSREEASMWEKYYVKLYNANDKDFGYNLTSGGDNNFTFSPETIEKMKQGGHKNKGKKRTPEQKQRISEETKKAMNDEDMKVKMRQIYDSEEWRQKNSDATKKQWENSDLREKVALANGKKVICVETQITYISATEAERQTGSDRHQIGQCCKGLRETDIKNNYHWKYI